MLASTGGQMPLTDETTIALRTAAICFVAVLLIAKIWRECAAEVLRAKLRVIEIELFDLVRHGRLSVSDPAYLTLMHCVRSIAWNANRFTITRLLAACAVGHGRKALGLRQECGRSSAACEGILDPEAQEQVAALGDRVLVNVRAVMLFGPAAAVRALPGAEALADALRGLRLLLGSYARIARHRAQRARSVSAAA